MVSNMAIDLHEAFMGRIWWTIPNGWINTSNTGIRCTKSIR
jgi:hypothetical protein